MPQITNASGDLSAFWYPESHIFFEGWDSPKNYKCLRKVVEEILENIVQNTKRIITTGVWTDELEKAVNKKKKNTSG